MEQTDAQIFTRVTEQTDAQILSRFVEQSDEAAFESLVERHGSMVMGVCRRQLGESHDAEDAFQATFLVLAQNARKLRDRQSVGSWLHGVALRVARKARARSVDRRSHERRAAEMIEPKVARDVFWNDAKRILDAEINRLPEKLRDPLVLCYIEGRTNVEAAEALGWTKGTVSGRLARARDALRQRLMRRGVSLFGTIQLYALIEDGAALAPVSSQLVSATAKVASTAGTASALGAGTVSPHIAVLTKGATQMIHFGKLKTTAAVLVATMVLGGGTGLWMTQVRASEDPKKEPAAAKPEQPAVTRAQINDWFKLWTEGDHAQREDAEGKLLKAGENTRAAMKEKEKNSDPEVRAHAKRMLGKLKTYPLLERFRTLFESAQTCTGKLAMKTDVMGMKMAGKGVFRNQRDPQRMRMNMTVQMMGQSVDTLTVHDGKTVWIEMTINKGQKVVQKMSGDFAESMGKNTSQQGTQDPINMMNGLLTNYDFTSQEEGVLDGKPVWIVKGAYKPGTEERIQKEMQEKMGAFMAQQSRLQLNMQKRPIAYLDKTLLVPRKLSFVDEKGKELSSMTFSNLQFNQKLKPELFVYSPPEGVNVMDLAEMLKGMKQLGMAAKKTENTEKDTQKQEDF